MGAHYHHATPEMAAPVTATVRSWLIDQPRRHHRP
jgi:hypothetical protein